MITEQQRDNLLLQYYNENILQKEIRSYEVSLWTLQDEFITVLKWSDTEQKGRVEKPLITLGIDGTESFECDIPMYIYQEGKIIENPNWYNTRNGNLIVDFRKLKVILNKGTNDEGIFEFVIDKITESHEKDILICSISATGLAFHELGHIGYKIDLSQDTFINYYSDWEKNKISGNEEQPICNLDFWMNNDKAVGMPKWNTDWDQEININLDNFEILPERYKSSIWYYDVQMDWSSFKLGKGRDSHKIYEESYTMNWGNMLEPLASQDFKEKARPVSASNSNIYNITQTIAETFGVFCKYEYGHDENYHITYRKIIFYNNFIQEGEQTFSLTYPFSSSKVSRSIDSTDLTTKLYVLDVDNSNTLEGRNSIMNSEANATHEDYILNFEYLYKTGAINKEQYDAIYDFNLLMSNINNQLIPLYESKALYENKKTDAEAQKKVFETGKDLAAEQITQNTALQNALDIKDGTADGLITLDSSNPAVGIIIEDSLKGNYINLNINNKGIKTDTVKIYRNQNLTTEIKNFNFEFDEYGNATKIKGRTIVPLNNSYKVYMTYSYSPKLYYDSIVKVWRSKFAEDSKGYDEQSSLLNTIDDILNNPIDGLEVKIGQLENEKRKAIRQFDAMMGPALREGYWQPEDYTDYGNYLSNTFTLTNTFNNSFVTTDTHQNGLLVWDDEIFDGEEDIYYQQGNYKQGVISTKYYYPCIKLSSTILNKISANIDKYSFIFNNNYNKPSLSQEELASIQYTQNFQIGSQAKVGFIKDGNNTVIPVIILLGAKTMTDGQITHMKNANPRLGVFTAHTDQNTGNIYVDINSNDYEIISITNNDWINVSSSEIVYPRIKFSSLDLKTDSDNITIYYNDMLLQNYEDFYCKSRVNSENGKLEYFVTIKPQSIIKTGVLDGQLTIDYILSNANTQIYLDALLVSKENSMPKVSYEISPSILNRAIIRILYKKLAHLVMINDNELKFTNVFGYISSVKLNLEDVTQDSIEIKNYKTKFEDLFSNIVAQTESMKCASGQIAAAIQGNTPLSAIGLASSLEDYENIDFLNSFLDNYINNSAYFNDKLKSLFTEAGEVLTGANKALKNSVSSSLKNANILSGFIQDVQNELTVKVFRQSDRPDDFKVGDIWIRTDQYDNEIARYVATVNSSEQRGIVTEDHIKETSGFTKIYDGNQASLQGQGLTIDAEEGIINIVTMTESGSNTESCINLISGTYSNLLNPTYYDNSLSKISITPKKIDMASADIFMRGANSIQILTSSNQSNKTNIISLDNEHGIFIGSGNGITLYAGAVAVQQNASTGQYSVASTEGASVELKPGYLLFGVSNIGVQGASATAVEMTKDYLILAAGSGLRSLESNDISFNSALTGVKIKKDFIGLAVYNGNDLSTITMGNNGIKVGVANNANKANSYVSIASDGITVGSSGKIAISTTNFLLDTSKTGTDLMLRLGTAADAKLTFSMTNGLNIKGSVTATSFLASSTKGQIKLDASSFGFYDTSGNAVLTINGTAISASGNLTITANKNFSLSAGGVTINTAASSGTIFSVWKNNKGISVDVNGNLTVTGTINATGGTFSGTITASGTIRGGTISGATITGGSLNIGNGACTIGSDGYLYASDAYIGGEINSSAGTIGGWTIGDNGMASGNLLISDASIGYCYIQEGQAIVGGHVVGFTHYTSELSTGISSNGTLKVGGTTFTSTDIQHLQTLWTAYNTPVGNDYMTYEAFRDELLSYLNNDEDVISIIAAIARSAVNDNSGGKD